MTTSDRSPATPDRPATGPTGAAGASGASARDAALPALAAFLAAVLGHVPLLGAWWCRDDWGLLARAAGLIDKPHGLPARWLSQHAYWQLTWPLFGLNPAPHAVVRLLLHGLASLLVARLARRGGLRPAGALLAGLVFAGSPLAFLPLYWAAGIQELLAAALALLAIDRWLAAGAAPMPGPNAAGAGVRTWRDGSGPLVAAALAGLGALLAKESALGLGLLLGGLLLGGAGPRGRQRGTAAAIIGLLLAGAVGAAWLSTRLFDTGAGSAYQTGGPLTFVPNVGVFGHWLVDPGPVVRFTRSWSFVFVGWGVMLAWAGWGAWRWRRGQWLPLTALAGTLLALAPMLPLRQHIAPYQAYLAAAGWALALGALLPRRVPLPRLAIVVAVAATVGWGLFTCSAVKHRRNELGLPADDIVRATSLSWQARDLLRGIDQLGGGRPVNQVTLLQFPAGPGALEYAQRFGERWAGRTDLHEALGGDLGPRLLVPKGVTVRWQNGLVSAPDSAVVLVETGTGLRPWGRTAQAALYAALTDVGLGNFERARGHLLRAARLGNRQIAFACDEELLPIPLALVLQQQKPFMDWTVGLLAQGASRAEVGGLQDMFLNLLCGCTGRSLEELTRGSRVLLPGEPPPESAPGP